jgi:anti-sigma factor RsiW
MKNKISPSEWEALSAYLDNQLAPKARAQLQSQLETRADLRQAFQGLRRTRAAVRYAPRPRAPRHFTLTPEMAGVRSRSRSAPGAYPVLRLASVLATIFFLIVFMGDLVSTRLQPAALPIAQMAKEQGAPNAPIIGLGGGVAEDAQAVVEAPAPEAPALEAPSAEATAAPESLQMEASPEAFAKGSISVTPVGDPRPTATLWEGAALLDSGLPEGEVLQEAPPEAQSTVPAGWSVLRVFEILLALLAIFSAAAAYWARRVSIR